MKVESESEVARSCLTLSDPMDCSQPGSSVYGIFQATVLEWGAIAFSRRFHIDDLILFCEVGTEKVKESCPTLCDTMTVAHQAPLSMEFSRQEY